MNVANVKAISKNLAFAKGTYVPGTWAGPAAMKPGFHKNFPYLRLGSASSSNKTTNAFYWG